jgi:hypothetical protein
MKSTSSQMPSGTSVVEVVVALSLTSLLVLSVGNLLNTLHRVREGGGEREVALAAAREGLDLLASERDTFFACHCTSDGGPDSCTGNQCTRAIDSQVCALLPSFQSCWTQYPKALMTNGPIALQNTSGVWSLVAGEDTTVPGITRWVQIENLQRDTSGSLVASGGTTDTNTKKMSVTAQWLERGQPKTLTISSILTGWRTL